MVKLSLLKKFNFFFEFESKSLNLWLKCCQIIFMNFWNFWSNYGQTSQIMVKLVKLWSNYCQTMVYKIIVTKSSLCFRIIISNGERCDTMWQGLIGLIWYIYQQSTKVFSKEELNGTKKLSVLGLEQFEDGWPSAKLNTMSQKWLKNYQNASDKQG